MEVPIFLPMEILLILQILVLQGQKPLAIPLRTFMA